MDEEESQQLLSENRSKSTITKKKLFPEKGPRKSLGKKMSQIDTEGQLKKLSKRPTLKAENSDDEEPTLPPLWYNHAYRAYMKTNHIVDLYNEPGKLYYIDSVEGQDYTNALACVHPYFIPRTKIPPLIKTSTIQHQTNLAEK